MIENAGKGCKTSNFGLDRGGGGQQNKKFVIFLIFGIA